jgi:hypothetical protein
MDINTYKNTLLSKIADCNEKYEYYKSFADNVTAASWQGKREGYEDALILFGNVEFKEETKEVKTNGRKIKN